MEDIRAHIFVSGFVQGVFFRANLAEKAENLKLTGWVRNLSDGRVEAILEGKKDRMKEVIGWIKGQPWAWQVDDVKIDWQNPSKEFKNFEIRY